MCDFETDFWTVDCAHSAFRHPDAPEDAQPRESVEVRCLVFYEDEKVSLGEVSEDFAANELGNDRIRKEN